jgi:indolepyruvate ferredoxin oxidoreductase alpha subunit
MRVVISRRECALIRTSRQQGPISRVRIDAERCFGDDCGCSRYCTRVFKCPGLIWDRDSGKAKIDEAVCNGCGVCVSICPQSAIVGEAVSEFEEKPITDYDGSLGQGNILISKLLGPGFH